VYPQIEQLKEDAVASTREFSSRMRQLEVENVQLKQQLLQQQQQQALQSAAGLKNDTPSKDVMKLMEQAHAEQQKMTLVASAAQMKCDCLEQQLAASLSAIRELQDTAKRQQQQTERQEQQVHEWQLQVEEERILTARAVARASTAEAEVVRISHAAMATAAAAEREFEDQQQCVLTLQELLQKKCECAMLCSAIKYFTLSDTWISENCSCRLLSKRQTRRCCKLKNIARLPSSSCGNIKRITRSTRISSSKLKSKSSRFAKSTMNKWPSFKPKFKICEMRPLLLHCSRLRQQINCVPFMLCLQISATKLSFFNRSDIKMKWRISAINWKRKRSFVVN